MRLVRSIPALILVASCAHVGRRPPAQYDVDTSLTPPATANAPVFIGPKADDVDPAAVDRILVLQSRNLPRPTEVVGIVDAHEATGNEALALLELRQNAARLGADAVVGVEFHHAENPGEPLHLSGLAVRFVEIGVLR